MADTAAHSFAGLIPEVLLQRIRDKRCVLFAGSGLSAQAQTADGARPPTWQGLLEGMIDWCGKQHLRLRAEPEEFTSMLARGRLLMVAQELQESLGAQLNSCLADVLRVYDLKPSEAHRMLCGIRWANVLTSNYDSLIESAYTLETEGIAPAVYSWNDVNQAIEAFRNGRFFIFKVHGDVNIQSSIILGNRDYSRLLHTSPAYRSFLETVFSTHTVLFVGFGGSDPDLDGIVDRLSTVFERSTGPHFLLISEDEYSFVERLRIRQDKGLDCITYTRDASHSQVLEFLKALALRTTPGHETPAQFQGTARQRRVLLSDYSNNLSLLPRIAEIAKETGFDVWFADRELRPGDSIVDAVSKALDETDSLIVLISKGVPESPWLNFELERAYSANKPVLVIHVGGAPIPPPMGELFLQIESASLTANDEALLRKVVARFREYA